MWWQRRVLLVAALCALSSCGFEPIYANRSAQNYDIVDLLIATKVVAAKDLRGEQFKAEMEDLLNPEAVAVAPAYRLELGMETATQPFIFNSDGTAGRYQITLTAPYVLYRMADNKPIKRGRSSRVVSYNVSEDDDYSTYISMNDALKRVGAEAAEDIKMQLSTYYASIL